MTGNFNPIVAALCLASLNQLSEFSYKELMFERLRNNTAFGSLVEPINLKLERNKILVLAVSNGTATDEQIKEFKELAVKKAKKAEELYQVFYKTLTKMLVEYTTIKPDISQVLAKTKLIAKQTHNKILKSAQLFLPLKDVEQYSKVFLHFIPALEVLHFSTMNPSKILLVLFKKALANRLDEQKAKNNFKKAFQEVEEARKKQPRPENYHELELKLFVTTVCIRIIEDPEKVLNETTSEQLKNLEEDSHQIFNKINEK